MLKLTLHMSCTILLTENLIFEDLLWPCSDAIGFIPNGNGTTCKLAWHVLDVLHVHYSY